MSASPAPIKVQGNTAFMSNKWYRNTQKKETKVQARKPTRINRVFFPHHATKKVN